MLSKAFVILILVMTSLHAEPPKPHDIGGNPKIILGLELNKTYEDWEIHIAYEQAKAQFITDPAAITNIETAKEIMLEGDTYDFLYKIESKPYEHHNSFLNRVFFNQTAETQQKYLLRAYDKLEEEFYLYIVSINAPIAPPLGEPLPLDRSNIVLHNEALISPLSNAIKAIAKKNEISKLEVYRELFQAPIIKDFSFHGFALGSGLSSLLVSSIEVDDEIEDSKKFIRRAKSSGIFMKFKDHFSVEKSVANRMRAEDEEKVISRLNWFTTSSKDGFCKKALRKIQSLF